MTATFDHDYDFLLWTQLHPSCDRYYVSFAAMIRAFALATIYKRATESHQGRDRTDSRRESRRASPTVTERRPDEASRALKKYWKSSNRRQSRIENCNGTATTEDSRFLLLLLLLFFFSFFFFFSITEIVEEAEKYPLRGNLSFLCLLAVWFRIL
ncbi:hypothetical protein L873DRAFT_1335816 [Choiromyces venosus 120613-1]|uniref:Uncharacterized protein n=1 Tax=Choiromyces venosus 120613-1 TaxID=1336337 RepID=A0A3N4JAH1_9PEZI|nr:hypothetical protein L873DRAFT_1335816 [Choiromyces venosus 120613-1]